VSIWSMAPVGWGWVLLVMRKGMGGGELEVKMGFTHPA
jgi:hypothetical protein